MEIVRFFFLIGAKDDKFCTLTVQLNWAGPKTFLCFHVYNWILGLFQRHDTFCKVLLCFQTNLPIFKLKESSVRRRYSDFEWLRAELERESKVSRWSEMETQGLLKAEYWRGSLCGKHLQCSDRVSDLCSQDPIVLFTNVHFPAVSVLLVFFVRWLCLLCQAKLCSGSFRLEGTTAFSTTRSSKSGGKVWSSSSTSKPEHTCVFLLTQVQVHQATMQDLQLHLRRIK